MKNYVVWTNCTVNESDDTVTKFNLAPVNNDAARNGYSQINKISRDSAKKYLQGAWEEIVYTDPAPSRTAIFQRNWQRIHDLWHKEPCNILYLDSDTIIIRPTEIFDRFAEFRVFNWTDPKFNEKFENLYNAGVRYYPATMSRDLWPKIGILTTGIKNKKFLTRCFGNNMCQILIIQHSIGKV